MAYDVIASILECLFIRYLACVELLHLNIDG